MPISILEAVVAVGGASLVSVLIFHFVKAWWTPLVILGVFWATGIVVGPLTNHTFIQPADLFDTSELHHDQIVALLGVLGVVGAVWAELRLRKATRAKTIASQA
ncbi:MAG TPA: hypothetical protein VK189_01640 [Thermoplasmata archaeon]|nr:hypothetical protein [Thermoplasmata archaeon]